MPCIKSLLIRSIILGSASLLAYPAWADTGATLDLLKILRERNTINQSEFKRLRNAVQADKRKESAEQAQLKKKMAEASQNSMKVKAGHKGLTVESADGDFKFKVGGRIHVDSALFDEDKTNLGSGSELRRARLKISGTVWRAWDYKLEMDFAKGKVKPTDVWIAYRGFNPFSITVGHQKEPFSLSTMTSSNAQVFQERALNNALVTERNLGIVFGTYGTGIYDTHWTANGGFFGEDFARDKDNNEGYGVSGRVTFAPIATTTRVLHLGLSGKWRTPNSNHTLRFQAKPESDIASVHLVDTGVISHVNDFTQLGAEFSALRGPLSLDAEYIRTDINRSHGSSNPSFDGWYVQASYFLTGESRVYNPKVGHYEMPIPESIVGEGGIGAWEIAARYSTLDLENSGIRGGKERNITLGINWWATQNIMFRANYVRAMTDPNSNQVQFKGAKEDINIFMVRAQLAF